MTSKELDKRLASLRLQSFNRRAGVQLSLSDWDIIKDLIRDCIEAVVPDTSLTLHTEHGTFEDLISREIINKNTEKLLNPEKKTD